MKLKPLHDNVVVRPTGETATASGIVIAESNHPKGGLSTGTVVATGPGAFRYGVRASVSVEAGDLVFFTRAEATQLIFDNEKLLVMGEESIRARVARVP